MQPRGAELTIVTTEAESGRRGTGDSVRRIVESRVSVEVLQANLGGFVETIRDLLDRQATRAGAFELDEVALSVEIGADGELKLLGAGVGVHGSSGIQLTWRREPEGAPGS
jgi:hypothetical protein